MAEKVDLMKELVAKKKVDFLGWNVFQFHWFAYKQVSKHVEMQLIDLIAL